MCGRFVSASSPALLADRFAVVRSLSHPITAHNPATYYTLTGHIPVRMSELATPERNDHPALGAVLAKDAPPVAGWLPSANRRYPKLKRPSVNQTPRVNAILVK